jgi:hypothetical protein
MEPESSSPHSQAPATYPYPEPDQSSPCPHHTSLRSTLIVISHLSLGLPSGLFHSDARIIIQYAPVPSPIRATCLTNLIFLDVISRITFGEQYRPLISSLNSSLLRRPSGDLLTQPYKEGAQFVSTNDGYIKFLNRRILDP